MLRISLLALAGLCFFSDAPAIAQPSGGFGFRDGSRLPEIGSELPDVTVYDDHGREFSTMELRGHYTVLVFGCLT